MGASAIGFVVLVGSNVLLAALSCALAFRLFRSDRDSPPPALVPSPVPSLDREAIMASFKEIDARIAKLSEDFAASATATGIASSVDDLDMVGGMIETIRGGNLAGLETAVGGAGDLLEEMNSVAPAGYEAWKASRQSQIDAILNDRVRLKREADELREQLEKASAMIVVLQSKAKRLGNTEAQVLSLEAARESLRHELNRDRHRRNQLEVELAEARQSETSLRSELGRLGERVVAAETGGVQRESELSSQLAAARAQYNEVKDILERTLVEKNFIESAFLESDNAAEAMRSEQEKPGA